jgi:hypothetical protein
MIEFTRSSSAGANPPGVTVNNTRAEWASKELRADAKLQP